MTEYGADVSTYPDLDVSGRNIDGARAVAECFARRITTPVLEYAQSQNEYLDVREYLSKDLTTREIFSLSGRIRKAALFDERLKDASIDVSLVADRIAINAQLLLETNETLSLVLEVGAMTTELLLQ